jgi:hypothetical protein
MLPAGFEHAQWLFPLAITIHNIEEAVWLPAWSKHAARFHAPVGAFEFRFAVIVLTLLGYVITFLSVRYGSGSVATGLFCAYCLAMLLNAFVPHLAAAIVLRRYAPGLATGLLVNVPVTAWLLHLSYAQGHVTMKMLAVSSAVMIPALLASIPLLFAAGRALDKLKH